MIESRWELAHKKKKKRLDDRISFFLLLVIVLTVAFSSWRAKMSIEAKNAEYQSKIESIQSKIEEQDKRTEELDEYKVHVKTKQFAEEVAKEKFGLIYPNELVLKPEK